MLSYYYTMRNTPINYDKKKKIYLLLIIILPHKPLPFISQCVY